MASRPAAALVGLAVAAALLGGRAAPARAGDDDGPVRIDLECQDSGRTKACPAFLLGFIEATPLLRSSPRANAQVVLYVTAVEIANDDRLHLRYVGDVRGAPASIELDVDVDTRATDDDQRAQLEPAFLRGVALYIAVRHPEAVKVTLEEADASAKPAPAGSPWSASLEMNAFGSWSGPYKSSNGYADLSVYRTTARSRWRASVSANGGLNRQPAVNDVSFNTTNWGLSASSSYHHHLNRSYAAEVSSRVWRDDPKGEYRFGWAAQAQLEWDHYPSDDPRGNLLAVGYGAGYTVEGYNFRNVLGERFAQYPEHWINAAASIRKDKISCNLQLQLRAELLHPDRRYTVSGSPGVDIQLGAHVDIGLSMTITRRELPDFVIPDDDPEAIGRAAYAQPLSLDGFLNLRLHWDATNGVRNNRFTRM